MKKSLTTIARILRKKQTPQEGKLWAFLRRKNFKHLKFRRQYIINNYVVDFCCPEKKLIIELDGSGHTKAKQMQKDNIRDLFLKKQGFRVLRIWNNELDENIDGVFEKINELTN